MRSHIPPVVPRPNKGDLIKAVVLAIHMPQAEQDFVLSIPPNPVAQTPNSKPVLDPASLQRLDQQGVIANSDGSPTLTYFGEIVRYKILQEREYIDHPEWLEPS